MMETVHLDVEGMFCSACTARIEKVVSKIDGVSHVTVNLTTETGKVTFDKKRTSIDYILNKISHLGFKAKAKTDANRHQDQRKEISSLQWKFFSSVILTIPLAWAMLSHFDWATSIYIPAIFKNPFFQFLITVPIQFIIGFQFYERAWSAVKNGSTNMDVLVVLSTSAAFFYSHYVTFTTPNFLYTTESDTLFYETSAFIITFILLGRLLEQKSKSKTKEALEKLYQIQTKLATLYENGQEVRVDIEDLMPGNQIVVKPGEKVPIDGQVSEGYSMIDESLLTGESVPVEKVAGSQVFAGTINQNGLLMVQVTKTTADTTLSHIISIVEEAQASKAPIQHIADKITGDFVPIDIIIALITFVGWYFLLEPGSFNGALGKVIAVLIIACPCALGLATPTSIMVGSGRAAQSGILFKEGKFLELLGKSDCILLDKTGTVTKGFPQVTNIHVDDQFDFQYFIEMIGAVEQTSDHPIAQAIYNYAKNDRGNLPKAHAVENVPGYGIRAVVNGLNVVIASPFYYQNKGISLPVKAVRQETFFKNEGKTTMLVFIDQRYAGLIAVSDEIKPTSQQAISRLKKNGKRVILLTGDHERAGLATAKAAGITEVYTECTPEDKARIIAELEKDGKDTVMVGDGINDAPALATANVGVAIGTGSDVAIETGDVTIIKGDLNKLVDAINISQKTMTNIKQNFVWAFLYNMIMIPFAMFGILVPWLAGAAMAFSSISVVLNSLRLKKVKI